MNRRLGNHTIALMMLTAGFFDLIGAIPFLNIPMSIIGWLIFGLWFIKLGISWQSPKKLAAPAASMLIEIIPVLSAIPSFIFAIGTNIAIITYEDYRAALKKRDQKTSGKFAALERHYSSKQIVSRPPITPNPKDNTAEPESSEETNFIPSQYGVRDQSSPKNIYISDVKPKAKKNESPDYLVN